MFFGRHVFYPAGQWDWAALAIATVAAVALLRWRTGTVKLLFAAAIAGLVLS